MALKTWQGCFLLTIVAVLLQAIPVVGILMFVVGGPLWPTILINLGFFLMGAEAWKGEQPRWMALAPLLWFGGYFSLAAASHWQAHRLNASVAAANAAVRIPFDWSRTDLVIEPEEQDTGDGASPLTAETLLERFDIGRVFTVENKDSSLTRAVWLERASCPKGIEPDGRTAYMTPSERGEDGRGRTQFVNGLCRVSTTLQPSRPVMRVQPQQWKERRHGLTRESRQDIIIRPPNGDPVVVGSGMFRPFAWLPTPVIGCGLERASDGCGAFFRRASLYDPGEDSTSVGPDDVVARALGLRKTTVRERYPDLTWHGISVQLRPR